MRDWLIVLMFAFVGGLSCTSPARAASFDCRQSTTADEKAVCANASLSALDSEMGGLWYAYSRVPMLMGSSGARTDEAQAFQTRRRQCGANAACLKRAYVDRIAQLKQQIAQWMQTPQCAMTGGPACAR